ncbi:MAG: serine dehydrogenasease, partial [Candidatus Omnitrophica bacterium]|nr:serine dehydrogenasease [Candidatus Omnitrophota bacterium]
MLQKCDGKVMPNKPVRTLIHSNANTIIEEQLDAHLSALEDALNTDVLVYVGGIVRPADDLMRDAIDSRTDKRNTRLSVIIETDGGYIEVAHRIADAIRHHYRYVAFIIPNYAMSAGTVLVMSGDAIYMDYYSILGPIDPQVERPNGGMLIPALGYLAQYERLVKKSQDGQLSTAEMAFLVQKFDPAELYRYEQERELSVSLLKEWLVRYKFKNWKTTATKRRRVTQTMREARAEEIARKLNDTEHWHSHSRGISINVLRKDLKLLIEDFGKIELLNTKVKTYYKLLKDYMMRRGHEA